MFIRFGSRSKGIFEDPCFIWKDADGRVSSFAPKKSFTATERIGLFDVLSIKKPTMIELDGYPLAIPENCFILLMNNGASLLFEAIDNFQMTRISTAIRGIVAKMARNIVTGDNAWVTQMLTSVDKNVSDDDIVVSVAMTDVTDQLIRKSIMQQAQDRLRKKRSSR